MQRIPTPELVRFLVHRWSFSFRTLADIQSEMPTLPPDVWKSFDRAEIEHDLDEAIRHRGGSVKICDFAKPIALCLFDDGQQGKTTFAHLLAKHEVPVFSTDEFVGELRGEWHDEERLRDLAAQTFPQCVNEFIRRVETDTDLAQQFVALLFDQDHGFNLRAPVSVIEGYLHNEQVREVDVKVWLGKAIVHQLRKKGYRVWLTKRCRDNA